MATETKDPQKKSNAITRFLGEFKEFISKGNVLDMAVGVVVGSAFTAIVNALVDNVLMPLVGAVIAGINFQDLGFHIPWGNHPYINIGAFLSAVITFLITAFCVFLIVKAVNTMRNLTLKKKEEEMKKLQGEQTDIGWGNQIRSYVFQPYTMVKDHRTNCESGNIRAVMDGDIDQFINSFLRWNKK